MDGRARVIALASDWSSASVGGRRTRGSVQRAQRRGTSGEGGLQPLQRLRQLANEVTKGGVVGCGCGGRGGGCGSRFETLKERALMDVVRMIATVVAALQPSSASMPGLLLSALLDPRVYKRWNLSRVVLLHGRRRWRWQVHGEATLMENCHCPPHRGGHVLIIIQLLSFTIPYNVIVPSQQDIVSGRKRDARWWQRIASPYCLNGISFILLHHSVDVPDCIVVKGSPFRRIGNAAFHDPNYRLVVERPRLKLVHSGLQLRN